MNIVVLIGKCHFLYNKIANLTLKSILDFIIIDAPPNITISKSNFQSGKMKTNQMRFLSFFHIYPSGRISRIGSESPFFCDNYMFLIFF